MTGENGSENVFPLKPIQDPTLRRQELEQRIAAVLTQHADRIATTDREALEALSKRLDEFKVEGMVSILTGERNEKERLLRLNAIETELVPIMQRVTAALRD
ncbi:MAG: hypothetical protein WA021_01840 [Minisyncoccia bacterium]